MKLSISNIGWPAECDEAVYKLMKEAGYCGLEIAPTRIFSENPYDRKADVKEWSGGLFQTWGFRVSSMQSIWYGRREKIFGGPQEREALLEYTKKAVDFAEAAGCGNLVFGCPVNRALPPGAAPEAAIGFFREIGDYAYRHDTIIGMEANPAIYHTNFLNTTEEALDFIEQVGSDGLLLNLDTGTMVENAEGLSVLRGREHLIHHVHISEPGLKPLRERALHRQLADMLRDMDYQGYVSIEAGRQESMEKLTEMLIYAREIFG